MNRRAPFLLTFVVALLLQTAWGRLGVDGSPDAAHVSAGLNFRGGVLWVSCRTQAGTPFYESATYLDSYNVLMTTHQLFNAGIPVTLIAVGNGNSYSNSPGTTVAIHDIVAYAGYVSLGSSMDLAIAHLSAPLPLPCRLAQALTSMVGRFH
ncbi:MAG: hypothetical protein WCS94_02890 [Verrucomicrobiota bacterium]